MTDDVLTLYEKCQHLRVDSHPWYPHDYNRELDTTQDEKLIIGGKWDGGYWCPGGRERQFRQLTFGDLPKTDIDAERLPVWVEVSDADTQ